MPRLGGDSDTIWVEVEPCVVLHTINAYDDENGSSALTPNTSKQNTQKFSCLILETFHS